MRVLVVEDDLNCSESLKKSLIQSGVGCDVSHFGLEGFEMIKSANYDAVIADIGLPDISGNKLIQKIRVIENKNKGRLPILVVSGLSSIDSKIESFVYGADDFITKPFNFKEILIRIQNLIRRTNGHTSNIINIRTYCSLDIGAKELIINEKKINLTSKEYELFELLVLRKGSALTKRTILDCLYSGIKTPTQKIIDVIICKIRKKLNLNSCNPDDIIETVWGTGYRINIKGN